MESVEVVRLLIRHRAEAVIGVEPHDVTLFFSDIGVAAKFAADLL